jgi:glutamate-1-semialdehyde 2,1-aminomutase
MSPIIEYIDFLQAGGPTVLGSNYRPVREKVIELLNTCGAVTGLFHEYEFKLASLINRFMPHVEMFRMLASGTEGAMAAIRLSRAFTGAKKVIRSAADIMAGAISLYMISERPARKAPTL